jgi:hypothetical protein
MSSIKIESKFCKVCNDAKKSEAECKSHNVKDKAGNTTCPTLLSQKCRYCDKSGHTVKFCATLEKVKKERAKEERIREYNGNQNVIESRKPAAVCNRYNVFGYDSEEEEGEIKEEKVIFPVLSDVNYIMDIPKMTNSITYASVLTKPPLPAGPPPKKLVIAPALLTIAPALPVIAAALPVITTAYTSKPMPKFKKSTMTTSKWANAESSDEEDEDEDEEEEYVIPKQVLPHVAQVAQDTSAW